MKWEEFCGHFSKSRCSCDIVQAKRDIVAIAMAFVAFSNALYHGGSYEDQCRKHASLAVAVAPVFIAVGRGNLSLKSIMGMLHAAHESQTLDPCLYWLRMAVTSIAYFHFMGDVDEVFLIALEEL